MVGEKLLLNFFEISEAIGQLRENSYLSARS